MLVLSRKKGEQVRIGPTIEITVLAISGGRVRLGLSAPRDILIDREEIRRTREPRPPNRSRADIS